MIVAYDRDGQAAMQFESATEAGIWAELPTKDIEYALKEGEYLHGFLYLEKDGEVDCPKWNELYTTKDISPALHALTMVSALDKDGMVYDADLSEILSSEDVYTRYFKPLTTREIFEAIRSSTQKKHAITERLANEKKEIDQLIISQAETNRRGEPCRYIPMADLPEFLEAIKGDLGIEGTVHIPTTESYLGKHQGICLFAVNEVVKPYTIEEWRGESNKSK